MEISDGNPLLVLTHATMQSIIGVPTVGTYGRHVAFDDVANNGGSVVLCEPGFILIN